MITYNDKLQNAIKTGIIKSLCNKRIINAEQLHMLIKRLS